MAELLVWSPLHLSPGRSSADVLLWGRPLRLPVHPGFRGASICRSDLSGQRLLCRLFFRTDAEGRLLVREFVLHSARLLTDQVTDLERSDLASEPPSWRAQGLLTGRSHLPDGPELLTVRVEPNRRGRLRGPFSLTSLASAELLELTPLPVGRMVQVGGHLDSGLRLIADSVRTVEAPARAGWKPRESSGLRGRRR